MESFDLIVIGGGAAGEKGAAQAAYFGKRVALIEKEPFHGGAMVNTGTLPSKTLRETALYLSGFRQRGLHGVDAALTRKATLDDFLFRLDAVVTEERARLRHNLERHRVTCFTGAARFVDAHTVEVQGAGEPVHLRGDVVLIATGSTPHRPALFDFDHQRVYDSDEMVRVHELPESMSVVGAGVIGCEYACLFAALGTRVTLLDGRAELLSFLDAELTSVLKANMLALGIELKAPATVTGCDITSDHVTLTLDDGGRLTTSVALVCAGREANTGALDLEKAGLAPGKRGQLSVDAQYRTAVPHIYAAGDVIGFPALASTSMEQARVAMCHAFDLRYKSQLAPVFPYGIFTIPEVSMAGATEEALKRDGVDYVVGRAQLAHNARGCIIGECGLLKLLFRREDMGLLGVHVIGEGATELVHIGLMALLSRATADLFIEACFNYPSLSEAYKYATYDALGRRAASPQAE